MDNIKELESHQIFVFGANEAYRHGAGAALYAKQKFGARQGMAGLVGQSYGIPTKDSFIQTLPLSKIAVHVNIFLKCALDHPDLEFLVTPIGCGLAGYRPADIAPLFKNVPVNVLLPDVFKML